MQSFVLDVMIFQTLDERFSGVNRIRQKLSDTRYRVFQKHVLASIRVTAKLLPNASLPSAAATIINLATVYSVL